MSACGNEVLGWPQSSFRFCCNSLLKKPDELFGQPSSVSKGKRVEYDVILGWRVANSVASMDEKKRPSGLQTEMRTP